MQLRLSMLALATAAGLAAIAGTVSAEQGTAAPSTTLEVAQAAVPVTTAPARAEWSLIADGFEVAELPALAGAREVDRLLLARIDPAKYSFVVRHSASGNKLISRWMAELGAVFVINGSYFHSDGSPSAPLIAGGKRAGPDSYVARHGAFVVKGDHADVVDLAGRDWRTALDGASEAMVSFPLLVAPDGSTRVTGDVRRVANRSFVGRDRKGHIVLGATREAFFGLAAFASFLKAAPLDLAIALNLDGGPLACQALDLGGQKRAFCDHTEVVVEDGRTRVLEQGNGTALTVLPIVLGVLERVGK